MSIFDFFRTKNTPPPTLSEKEKELVETYEEKIANFQFKEIEAQTFIVFDTETTGLDIEKDQLVSIAGIGVKRGQIHIAQSFETYVKNLQLAENESHSTTNKDIPIHEVLKSERFQKGIPLKAVLASFLAFIGDAVLVAHHAAFDIGILNHLYEKNFGIQLKNKIIDTAHLAIRLEKSKGGQTLHVQPETYSLDYWINYFEIEAADRHTAGGDSLITAQLLVILLRLAQKRGLHQTKELIQKRFF